MKASNDCQRLSRKDLIDYLVSEYGTNKDDAQKIIAQVLDGIANLLLQKADDKTQVTLNLPKFGTFKLSHTPARKGRNPSTGQEMEIGSRKRISFKPSPEFKEVIRGAFDAAYKA